MNKEELEQRIEYLHNIELFAILKDEEQEELARLERELDENKTKPT